MFPVRIAILSDNQNIVSMQIAMLKAVGFNNITRLETIDALRSAIKHFTFDLMIVNDVGAIKAPEAAAMCRDEVNVKDPCMLALLVTSKSTRTGIRKAICLGYDDVLRIPFSATTLFDKIKRLTRQDRTFIRVGGYFGPERRRVWEGPPAGIGERRNLKEEPVVDSMEHTSLVGRAKAAAEEKANIAANRKV